MNLIIAIKGLNHYEFRHLFRKLREHELELKWVTEDEESDKKIRGAAL